MLLKPVVIVTLSSLDGNLSLDLLWVGIQAEVWSDLSRDILHSAESEFNPREINLLHEFISLLLERTITLFMLNYLVLGKKWRPPKKTVVDIKSL